ncbi:hypothetical protein QUB63_34700 [Microcoleus sp. ARI1-B5]|uniref:hypothetical protein n=1 Tax=unclassified Microcoleus TaxID=2642155 RepID=UPI002FCF61FC
MSSCTIAGIVTPILIFNYSRKSILTRKRQPYLMSGVIDDTDRPTWANRRQIWIF